MTKTQSLIVVLTWCLALGLALNLMRKSSRLYHSKIKPTYTIYLDADNPFEKAYQIEIKVLQQLENNKGVNYIQFKESTINGSIIMSLSEDEFRKYIKD